jgi:Permuted papain-like amidase enzyme, YaeF/YiiX, C92 family
MHTPRPRAPIWQRLNPMIALKRAIGRRLARYLSKQRAFTPSIALCAPRDLVATLQAGDVLLVEGNTRFSLAIQYLTQSNWSHSALCIKAPSQCAPDEPCLIEADLIEGVRLLSLEEYTQIPTRICRPVGLDAGEIQQLIEHAEAKLGYQYDTQKISDLVRYLVPKPPVPERWRRRLIAMGSGDPTRAICSTLIAEAFIHVRYPILPLIRADELQQHETYARNYQEWQHIRKHRLYTPRDFDLSPYFQIVKPLPA